MVQQFFPQGLPNPLHHIPVVDDANPNIIEDFEDEEENVVVGKDKVDGRAYRVTFTDFQLNQLNWTKYTKRSQTLTRLRKRDARQKTECDTDQQLI